MQTADRDNKPVIFKNYTIFTDSISEIKNVQEDSAKDLYLMCKKIMQKIFT